MMLLVNTEFVILVYVKPLMPYDNIDFNNLWLENWAVSFNYNLNTSIILNLISHHLPDSNSFNQFNGLFAFENVSLIYG